MIGSFPFQRFIASLKLLQGLYKLVTVNSFVVASCQQSESARIKLVVQKIVTFDLPLFLLDAKVLAWADRQLEHCIIRHGSGGGMEQRVVMDEQRQE